MAIFSWLTQKLNGMESVVDSSKIKFSSNMSETESVYDKISDLNSDLPLYFSLHTGTTNKNGYLQIPEVTRDYLLISAIKLTENDTGAICLPYRSSNAPNSAQAVFVYDSINETKYAFTNITIMCIFVKAGSIREI